MLGTMHALPRGTDWDEGRVAIVIAAADELMMELSPAELAAAGEIFRKLAPRDAPLAIEARLSGKALTGFRALETSGRSFGEEARSEEHTSELQSLMRISYAVFCLKKKNTHTHLTK